MRLEHVCPKINEPVTSPFSGQGVMDRKEFIDTGNGLFAPTTLKWITVKVECSHCGKTHEYALISHPQKNES